jgi:hypothetical protein
MASFLRDKYVKNVTINDDALKIVSDYFKERAEQINTALNVNQQEKQISVSYMIRFDNKGYRLTNFDDVLKYFQQAKGVERICITLESIESISSNKLVGNYVELRLDSRDINNCILVVSSDDQNWVDSTFSGVDELITNQTNRNRFLRNAWTHFLVQIFGVTLGFILSLWAGIKVAPYLIIENAFVVSFLFSFLVFSNVWTYLNQQILFVINYYFPNLYFKRKDKDRLNWLLQALVGGIVIAFSLFLLNGLFSLVGRMLGEFVKK